MRNCRAPEILLGILLTIAALAIGATLRTPIGSTQQAALKNSENVTQTNEQKSFWRSASGDPTATFTLGLLVVGLGQALLFYFQLKLIRRSLTDTKLAAEAAKDGARAARDSADISRLSMIASQRAYVHHNGMRWLSHLDIKDGSIFWTLRPRWINSGNTPTRSLKVYVKFELLDTKLPSSYQFIPQWSDYSAMIAPHGEIESGHFNIEAEDLIAVRDGSKFLYVWGVAKYHDVFPATVERITRFCVVANRIDGDPLQHWNADSNPVEIFFPHYYLHNCTDEDCDTTVLA